MRRSESPPPRFDELATLLGRVLGQHEANQLLSRSGEGLGLSSQAFAELSVEELEELSERVALEDQGLVSVLARSFSLRVRSHRVRAYAQGAQQQL